MIKKKTSQPVTASRQRKNTVKKNALYGIKPIPNFDATKLQIKLVSQFKIKSLRTAKYNPKGRTEVERIKKLMVMIELFGLIYPIVIMKNGEVVDGHRRLAACIQLGWTEIPAIVYVGERTKEEVYAMLNDNQEQHKANEKLDAYLTEPNSIPLRVQERFMSHEKRFGRAMLNRLKKHMLAPTYLTWAIRVANYIGMDTDDRKSMIKIAAWMIDHKQQSVVREFVNSHGPAKKLWQCVMKNKPIERRPYV